MVNKTINLLFDKRFIGVCLVLVMMTLSLVGSAYAITGTIGSSRMILRDVEVGEVIERNILVRNTNDIVVSIELFSTGDIASWITIQESEFELAPDEEKKAYISIDVKENGVHEGNVNVAFTPIDGGNGVGLTSNIILIVGGDSGSESGDSEDSNLDDEDDEDDDDDDDDDDDSDEDEEGSSDSSELEDSNLDDEDEDDGSSDSSESEDSNNNDDNDSKNKKSGRGVIPILLMITTGIFAGFLIVLSIASRKQKIGGVVSDVASKDIFEVKNDIEKDVKTKPKKSVKKK